MSKITSLLAGVGRSIITPPKGILLMGYSERDKGNVGVHDDLTATALVLDDGKIRLAIVALDLLTLNEFIVDRVRARLAPTEMVLCCSHTHSGPIGYADKKSPRKNLKYIDSLVENIVAAVQSAQSSLVPARVEYALGEAEVGINRREKMPDGRMEIGRNPSGARDKSLQVLSVFTIGDRETRLVTLVNYACHGTVLGPDNNLVSADWIGVMRSKVESELGGTAMFIQGAAANINPDMYWNDEHVYEKVTEQGEKVAESVVQTVKHASSKLEITPMQMERSVAWLPTETKVETELPPKNYRRTIMDFAEMPSFMALFADLLLDTRYPWKPVIEARNGYWSIPMRVNAIRLGNLAWVSFAAETFTEIGMKVKAASPTKHTIFSSITDGCISYLHTEASHPEGGYEVDVAPTAYRYPGRFQPQCESIVLEETQTLLNKLWS